MGRYLKRVAKQFLDDNGIEVRLNGGDNIPTDRPVVFAISHRSGAIDRFVTMAALPVDDDQFMYMVREGSPLDVRAKESYGEGNKWIVPARSVKETAARVKEGFDKGARCLITYPSGTGTLSGEPGYVARGTAAIAAQAGAVVVPVTVHDTFTAEPFTESVIYVQVHRPIDPKEVGAQLGTEPTSADAVETLRLMVQHRLSLGYEPGP